MFFLPACKAAATWLQLDAASLDREYAGFRRPVKRRRRGKSPRRLSYLRSSYLGLVGQDSVAVAVLNLRSCSNRLILLRSTRSGVSGPVRACASTSSTVETGMISSADFTLSRDVGQILLVLLRDQHGLHAGAQGRQQLLLQAADGRSPGPAG